LGPGEGKGVTLGKEKVRKEQEKELERDQERREGREGGMGTRPTPIRKVWIHPGKIGKNCTYSF